jgi:hypothetical protein
VPFFALAEAAAAATSTGQDTGIAAIVISGITAISGIILALVKRGGPKNAVTAKTVTSHGATLTEHGVRLDELEQLIEATDPDVQSRNDRITKLEQEMAQERAAREQRRETQATADTNLAVAFARLDESLKNIKAQVESHNGNGRRSR